MRVSAPAVVREVTRAAGTIVLYDEAGRPVGTLEVDLDTTSPLFKLEMEQVYSESYALLRPVSPLETKVTLTVPNDGKNDVLYTVRLSP